MTPQQTIYHMLHLTPMIKPLYQPGSLHEWVIIPLICKTTYATLLLHQINPPKVILIPCQILFHNISPSHSHYALSLVSYIELKTYAKASKHESLKQATQLELLALKKIGTWNIVDLLAGVKSIGCRWVYKIKYLANGSIDRFIAWLVVKGYNQIEGLDYFDTYSPVAKLTTVMTIIALPSCMCWHLHQLDVNNAFLHGDIQEDVYMVIPLSVSTSKPNQVCKLVKSLYGIKQASMRWYERLTSFLIKHHYKQASTDHSLFVKNGTSSLTILLVYMLMMWFK